jgi:ankyrin repeat protein
MSSELIEAILQHNLGRVRTLLSQGADPNAPNEEGWRPLHVAIGELEVGGSPEFVTLLIDFGADVNAWDLHRHETPLLSASAPEGLEAARILLQAGADPNVRNDVGDSPLRLCVWEGDLELAALLLRHGAGRTINEFGGDFAWTALGIAAHSLNVPMIELLLEAGADPAATDDLDRTARDHLPPRESYDPHTWDQVMELLGGRKS